MAKFCTNCGTKGEEGAKVCTNCGTAFEDFNSTVNEQKASQNKNTIPQPTPMPSYGSAAQPTPMPGYGNAAQPTPMPNYGNNAQPTNVATMPKSEKNTDNNPAQPLDNGNMPPQNQMPNNGNMPPQNQMPNSGNMPPQNQMPNSGNMSPQNQMPNNGMPVTGVVPATNKGGNKKALAIVGIAVGIVIILIVAAVVIFMGSGSGYKSVIDMKLSAVEELDAEKLAKTYPVFMYTEEYDTFEDFVDDVDTDAMEGVEKVLEELEYEAGENVKLSYKIDKISDVSDKKFENFCLGIDEAHDYDTSKIKEIKKADITVTAKGDDDTYEFDWEDVYLIKDNGEWYILNMDFEFDNIDGSNSTWHYDFYEYYKDLIPSTSDKDDNKDSLY